MFVVRGLCFSGIETMEILLKILCVGLAVIPVSCFVNLAQMTEYGGQASQSSTYPDQPWTADKAVDGYLQHDNNESTCSFTQMYTSPTAWWKFSWRKTANVAYLEIYFRNRSAGIHVIPTSYSPNKVFTQGSSPCPTRVLNVTVNKATRGIALFNTKKPPVVTNCEGYRYRHPYATIETCEVKIMGCPYAHFGENCTPCGLCQDGLCDVFNGSCIQGCSTHVMNPPLCIHCKNGFYGRNCRETCGKCRTRTRCDDVTGTCPAGCQDHWSGPKCDVCQDGFHGSDCTLSCGHCRHGTHCNKTTGICTEGCQRKWNGTKCDGCETGQYGEDCTQKCGKCQAGTQCDIITGICPEGCQDSWTGSKCNDGELSNTVVAVISVGSTLFTVMILTILCKVSSTYIRRNLCFKQSNANQTVDKPKQTSENMDEYEFTAATGDDHEYSQIDSPLNERSNPEMNTYSNTDLVI
ncbi:multiple epidermal growth factor-like domains protein 10 isoform X2 [Ostrea edulis]|uniref:multiple epidermal growth factor-like domains protein 10 isoform X2 n=1 Tax=Ostrea edulis TaxID=37623 RepID=UPI0024AFA82D|nr:multiple epidermal growth factor-like domains protein 10 isoform X2 [Ostrea edulis]